MQCFCSVGTLRMRGLSSPTFRTMTCAVQSQNSPLPDVSVILGRYPWPALLGSSCLGATSQISVASDRAGLYGEEHRHFHLECRGQTGLCFVLSPMPAEFPEIAEGLRKPLGRSFWGIPPAASHPIPLSQPPSPPLRGGPKSLMWFPILPSFSTSQLIQELGNCPC